MRSEQDIAAEAADSPAGGVEGVVDVAATPDLEASPIELADGVAKHDIPLSAMVLNRVPSDPFTERERKAVTSFVEDRGYETSRRLLGKLEQSKNAQARLESSTPLPCIHLPESMKKGLELADELSHVLSKGAS